MRLKDKVAIVTGAASGIGKEIAVIFAREGAKVAIADLDQKAADATAREIDSTGKRSVGVAMDVANEQQVEDGTAKVVKTFGTFDVLVSNAGIQIVAPLVDFEFAKWKRLLSIHLDGAFLTTRAALRHLASARSPRSPCQRTTQRCAAHGMMASTPTSVISSTASSPRSPLGSAWTTVIRGSGAGTLWTDRTESVTESLATDCTAHSAIIPAPSLTSARSPGRSRRTAAA